MTRLLLIAIVMLQFASGACASKARSTLVGAPTPVQMNELWVEPADIERRDLVNGPGGAEAAPLPTGRYEFVSRDLKGFSKGYDVTDERGRRWSVKLGPEAQTEVVVSRLLWAVGYHQPAVYYLPRWGLVDDTGMTPQGGGRFRLESRTEDKLEPWAWHENPFVGTRQLTGLFVMMVLVNNWDVKTSQNMVYQVNGENRGPRHLYVVRDVGASLGRTSWFFPGTRSDIEGFEREPFIKSVDETIEFHYRGAWREPHLKRNVRPGDVRWICGLLARLSERQWQDTFRAGGYEEPVATRYIRRLQQKIADGLKLSADS
ncbi:MAG: hypothetical protein ACRD1Q_09210 [Vicinamibacterales bacterium]